MPTPPIKEKEMEIAAKAIERYGSNGAAAKRLGLSESTVRRRAKMWNELNRPVARARDNAERIVMPALPDPEMPIDDVIEHLTKASQRRLAAADASFWIQVRVPTDKPFGLVMIGDPHIDDPGCAWTVLGEHMDLIKSTKGMYAIGLGDYQNNWVGRLARLYGNQDTSSKTAWRLVEWFVRELGDKLLLLIKGNHDLWTGAGDPLDWIKTPGSISADWLARLDFRMPNDASVKIIAAHDFPGHSMWNPLHSNQRKAKFHGEADIYVAGHRHEWGVAHHEDGERRRVYWLARARGYKFTDDYAQIAGYHQQRYGASITAIIDPAEPEPVRRVHLYTDVAEAAEFLAFKRQRGKR